LEIILVFLPMLINFGKILNSSYMPRHIWLQALANLETLLSVATSPANRAHVSSFSLDEPEYRESQIVEIISTYFITLENELQKAFRFIEYTQ